MEAPAAARDEAGVAPVQVEAAAREQRPHPPAVQIWVLRPTRVEQVPTGRTNPLPLALKRARRMSHSGRRVILWGLGLYVISLVVAACCLDDWHPTADNGAPVKLMQLRHLAAAAPARPLLVMLGSSRTDGMFQAARFDGLSGPGGKPLLAYNLGVPAAGPLREYLYLREMLDVGLRPSVLLVEFLPPLLNERHRGRVSEEHYAAAAWMSLAELRALAPYFSRPGHKWQDWLVARLAPGYAFRFHLHAALLQAVGTVQLPAWEEFHDRRGYELPEWPSPEECARRREITRRQYAQTLGDFRMGKGPRRALRDLLEFCRREQIPVVLVEPPESSTFRSWYSAEGRAAPRRLLADLQAAYGVPVIDASTWVADEDFRDGHHVLARGADVFSSRLLEELRPLLEGPGAAGTGSAPQGE